MRGDERRLNRRLDDLAATVRNLPAQATPGVADMLARTTTVTVYPTAVQSFYACQPLTLLGAEVEGGGGVISVGGGTIFAMNVGTALPPGGTQVVLRRVRNRWVFDYGPADGGCVVTPKETPSTTLNVAVSPGRFKDSSAVIRDYAGTTSFALAASATNLVYLDNAGTLSKTTGSWPAGVVRLATVVTDGTKVTSFLDNRTFVAACLES